MRWEELFTDLEAQLEAGRRWADAGEVGDLVRAERATLTLVDRLRAHLGQTLAWYLEDGEHAEGPVSARLADLGADWVLIGRSGGELLLPLAAVRGVGGLSRSAEPDRGEVARRLGLGVVLRGLARDRSAVAVRMAGSGTLTGTIDRVGADHLDLAVHPADEPRRGAAVRDLRCLRLAAIGSLRLL